MYLPDGVLLRLNSRESVDWLIPTIRAISFLGHFLWSKAKICDLCSEVSCLYIGNTKIINLRESSKGGSFFCIAGIALRGYTPRPRGHPAVFLWIRSYEKQMICCTSILKVRFGEEWLSHSRLYQPSDLRQKGDSADESPPLQVQVCGL